MSLSEEKEIHFSEHELIVSMTDLEGVIVYVNDVFCDVAEFSREELIGQPHNIVRHRDMPRVIYRLMWERLLSGNSITAFVKNRTKLGNYYWVKAYVAPVFEDGVIKNFTSYRRVLNDFAKSEVSKLYKELREYEEKHSVDECYDYLLSYLEERGVTYDQLADRLSMQKAIGNADALKIDIDGYYIDHMIFKTNIVRSVALGKKDVKVVDSCCCNFGKKLKMLENMEFSEHPEWSRVHQHHNHVHSLMKEYVQRAAEGASEGELDGILKSVDKDTSRLIGALKNVVNTYVESRG